MPLEIHLGILAATNMKQRTRKLIEYSHAERLNYAVAGTLGCGARPPVAALCARAQSQG